MQHICCEGNVTGLQCVYLIIIIIVLVFNIMTHWGWRGGWKF